MLRELDAGIWVVDMPFALMGMHLGARMTVVRLEDGGLWLHSPVRWRAELGEAIAALGPVRYLVAPNCLHHLFLGPWRAAFPQAELYGSPGLAKKRKDLAFTGELGDAVLPEWEKDLDQILFAGSPKLNEVAFFHRPSGVLICTDMIFNLANPKTWFTKVYAKAAGVCGHPAVSRLLRLFIRDRRMARASVDRMLEWDFDRIVLSHGDVIERDGKAVFRDRYAWL